MCAAVSGEGADAGWCSTRRGGSRIRHRRQIQTRRRLMHMQRSKGLDGVCGNGGGSWNEGRRLEWAQGNETAKQRGGVRGTIPPGPRREKEGTGLAVVCLSIRREGLSGTNSQRPCASERLFG